MPKNFKNILNCWWQKFFGTYLGTAHLDGKQLHVMLWSLEEIFASFCVKTAFTTGQKIYGALALTDVPDKRA